MAENEEKTVTLKQSELVALLAEQKKEILKEVASQQKQAPAKPKTPNEAILSLDQETTKSFIPASVKFTPKKRMYVLIDGSKPVSFNVRIKSKKGYPLQWSDPQTKEVKALRYTSNYSSIFEDDQNGSSLPILERVVFIDGVLIVEEWNTKLQLFLQLHPDNGVWFKEIDPAAEVREKREAELKGAEAIVEANKLNSFEKDFILRELEDDGFSPAWGADDISYHLMLKVKQDPKKFFEVKDDPWVKFKGVLKLAVQNDVLELKVNRFLFGGRVIHESQLNEDAYFSCAKWLQGTSEGISMFNKICKELGIKV